MRTDRAHMNARVRSQSMSYGFAVAISIDRASAASGRTWYLRAMRSGRAFFAAAVVSSDTATPTRERRETAARRSSSEIRLRRMAALQMLASAPMASVASLILSDDIRSPRMGRIHSSVAVQTCIKTGLQTCPEGRAECGAAWKRGVASISVLRPRLENPPEIRSYIDRESPASIPQAARDIHPNELKY